MSNARKNRLAGLALFVLGAAVTALVLVFPGAFGQHGDGLLVAPIVAVIGVVVIVANRPYRRTRLVRARRSL